MNSLPDEFNGCALKKVATGLLRMMANFAKRSTSIPGEAYLQKGVMPYAAVPI